MSIVAGVGSVISTVHGMHSASEYASGREPPTMATAVIEWVIAMIMITESNDTMAVKSGYAGVTSPNGYLSSEPIQHSLIAISY